MKDEEQKPSTSDRTLFIQDKYFVNKDDNSISHSGEQYMSFSFTSTGDIEPKSQCLVNSIQHIITSQNFTGKIYDEKMV